MRLIGRKGGEVNEVRKRKKPTNAVKTKKTPKSPKKITLRFSLVVPHLATHPLGHRWSAVLFT